MRLDVDVIKAALSVERVLEHYGLRARLSAGWYRLELCPRCGAKSSRRSVAVREADGSWLHHGAERSAGGQCSGDLLSLVAACEGLDAKHDFVRVYTRAAELAGIVNVDADHAAELREQRGRERRRIAEGDAARRRDGAAIASRAWAALALRSAAGEDYLARARVLDVDRLLWLGAVRFTAAGDPAVAIRSPLGVVTSVATRHVEPGERPKVVVARGTMTDGSMGGTIAAIAPGGLVVLVEGVIDTLTAQLAWPEAVVLGANGAGNVPKLARTAAAKMLMVRARLLLVPHADEPGIRSMALAGCVAASAGITVDALDYPGPDLNDSWVAGWRPGATR